MVRVAYGGESWPSPVSANAIDIGIGAKEQLSMAVAKTGRSGAPSFELYEWDESVEEKLRLVSPSNIVGWPDGVAATAVKFCQANGKNYLAVGSEANGESEVFLYDLERFNEGPIGHEGTNWPDNRSAVGLDVTFVPNSDGDLQIIPGIAYATEDGGGVVTWADPEA